QEAKSAAQARKGLGSWGQRAEALSHCRNASAPLRMQRGAQRSTHQRRPKERATGLEPATSSLGRVKRARLTLSPALTTSTTTCAALSQALTSKRELR